MKKSRYSLFVALALAAISTSACEDTVSLSVKCDGTQDYWADRNENKIKGGECNGGVVGPIEFDVELDLSKGEKAVVCNKNGCEVKRYILSVTDDKRIVAEACEEGVIECGYCCGEDGIAKCSDSTSSGKTNSLCGDGSDKNTSYQCIGSSVIVQNCDNGCANGKCAEQEGNPCTNGDYRCNGEKVEICAEGTWRDAVGAQLCDEKKIRKCVDGEAKSQQCRDGAACNDGKCTDLICDKITDSSLVCKDGKVGRCGKDKQWTELNGDELCENDKILYCKNEDQNPKPVGCYSEGDKTFTCKPQNGQVVKYDAGCGNGMVCNSSFECEPKKYKCTAEDKDKYICANGGMLYDCNGVQEEDVAPASEKFMCKEKKRQVVVWCTQEESKHEANQSECSPNDNKMSCSSWCGECNSNGECIKCNTPQERCTSDLTNKTVCSHSLESEAYNYCYNSDSENRWVDSGKLGGGCVPNKYTKIDNNNKKPGSTICYNGNTLDLNLNNLGDEPAIEYNNTNENKAWEFAIHDSEKLEFYNCHNDTYKSEDQTDININCCEQESYFIKRTGYKYYQIESCKKEDDINYKIKAFQFDTTLNDALIGKDDDFLQNDIACLNVKNVDSSTPEYKPTMLIKDKSIHVNDGGAVYRAFQCSRGTECNSSHKQLCVIPNVDMTKQVYCQLGIIKQQQAGSNNAIAVANCPNGTVLQIKENDDTWRNVVDGDCGVNKTHQLQDFRCYLGDKSTSGKESHS